MSNGIPSLYEAVPVRDDIGKLPRRDLLRLARRASESVLAHLSRVMHNADPEDRPLGRFLEGLVLESCGQASFLRRAEAATPGPPFRGVDAPWVGILLRHHFPSQGKGFGEGSLDREAAMHFAEAATMELARFFRLLADGAADPSLRRLLGGMADREEARHERVCRTIF